MYTWSEYCTVFMYRDFSNKYLNLKNKLLFDCITCCT